jgi:predicted Rossmann fold flavoprotein
MGLSLKNVGIKVFDTKKKKEIYDDFGEMLFTHFGVSGPIILSCSAILTNLSLEDVTLCIDLKPALNNETIDNRLVREFALEGNKQISSIIRGYVPQSLVDLIIKNSKISPKAKCAEITKKQRTDIINALKNLNFKVKKLRPIEEAIVTSGGIDVKYVNPKTMESKLIKGLYFAGEVLDVDCFTGGFNIQTAFSTGYLAGKSIE